MSDPADIHVLVVDDQQIIRQGIATILGFQSGIVVVGTASNGQEAVQRSLELQPDIVLLDVRMPMMDGVAAAAQIHEKLAGVHVLMLTTFDDEAYIVDALRAGASGYLLKDMPAEQLAQAVRAVHGGTYQLAPDIAQRLIARLNDELNEQVSAPSLPQGIPLTEREQEILKLIAAGATNKEIAARLFLAEGTVKNHVSAILLRLGLRDRTQAAIYAHDRGLL